MVIYKFSLNFKIMDKRRVCFDRVFVRDGIEGLRVRFWGFGYLEWSFWYLFFLF